MSGTTKRLSSCGQGAQVMAGPVLAYVERLGDVFARVQSEGAFTTPQHAELTRLAEIVSARGAYHKNSQSPGSTHYSRELRRSISSEKPRTGAIYEFAKTEFASS